MLQMIVRESYYLNTLLYMQWNKRTNLVLATFTEAKQNLTSSK